MSKHLKRLAAPVTQGIPRKTTQWVARSNPGPHPLGMSIPLIMVLRDMLQCCDYADEGRKIIGARKIQVDGRVVTDPKFPVGLMDVVFLTDTKEYYRMLLDVRGRLRMVKVTKDDATWKLARIENKSYIRKKKIQLNLHDGRNILLQKDQYKTGDVLKIGIPEQKVLAHYALGNGAIAMLVGGQHVGELATVKDCKIRRGTEKNLVFFNENFTTVKENVFVVGMGATEVKLPEVTVL